MTSSRYREDEKGEQMATVDEVVQERQRISERLTQLDTERTKLSDQLNELETAERVPGPGLSPLLCLQHEELVSAGFSTPDFALAACELPHAGVAVGQREGFEFLGLGIEAQDRVRPPVADPHRIGLVDIDGVGLRPVARQAPARPGLGLA